MATVQIDDERQEQAQEYARIRRRIFFIDLAIGFLYLFVWLFSGWSIGLERFLRLYNQNEWLLVIVFAIIFGTIYYLVTLPLSFYESYLLPHHFKQSNQTFVGWIGDQIKSILLGDLLGGIILEIIYCLLRFSPDKWWLWAGFILLIINIVLVDLAPVLLFPIFYTYKPLAEDHQELLDRLIRLGKKAGTSIKEVYIFDMSRRTKAANAAIMGMGKTRRIALGDTLVSEFSTDEIETILAHELGHHVHNDLLIGIVVESLLTFGGLFISSLFLKAGITIFGITKVSDISSLPLFLVVLSVFSVITMPLSNAYSRWREKEADLYALEITQNPQAFVNALKRLANQNLSEIEPENWVEYLLYSHPSLSKRIQMAQSKM